MDPVGAAAVDDDVDDVDDADDGRDAGAGADAADAAGADGKGGDSGDAPAAPRCHTACSQGTRTRSGALPPHSPLPSVPA